MPVASRLRMEPCPPTSPPVAVPRRQSAALSLVVASYPRLRPFGQPCAVWGMPFQSRLLDWPCPFSPHRALPSGTVRPPSQVVRRLGGPEIAGLPDLGYLCSCITTGPPSYSVMPGPGALTRCRGLSFLARIDPSGNIACINRHYSQSCGNFALTVTDNAKYCPPQRLPHPPRAPRPGGVGSLAPPGSKEGQED